MSPEQVVDRLRDQATELGFHWGGIAPAVDSIGYPDLVRWIDAGYAGGMSYLADRLPAYRHPNAVLDGVRSIIVLATTYDATHLPGVPVEGYPADGGGSQAGRIARYAWSGDDYHDRIHPKLKHLCRTLKGLVPGSNSRGIVDTAPLMEREVAQLAGFGWRGKNTLLLNKQLGSYFFLSCLLTDVVLPFDSPHESAHCGTCTACLDACPTDAFPQPGVLDANRCISYLTIEHRDPIDIDLRAPMGDWLFGCDVCQEVCPWNRKRARTVPATDDPFAWLDLPSLFDLDDDQFRQRFRHTPLWRTRRRGILRNAAIVMGNQRQSKHLAALTKGIDDEDPLVRGATAWALGQFDLDPARATLRRRAQTEQDPQVQNEINLALANRWEGEE